MTVENKVVVIMGASSGIGEATANLLANKKAKLTIAARRMSRLQEIQQNNAGADILAVEADVSKADEVQNVIDKTWENMVASMLSLTTLVSCQLTT